MGFLPVCLKSNAASFFLTLVKWPPRPLRAILSFRTVVGIAALLAVSMGGVGGARTVFAETIIPTGMSDFEFIDTRGNRDQPIRVWTYRPEKFTSGHPIVFVMHGLARNGEAYRKPWIDIADRQPCLIVVPEFSMEHYADTSTYQFGNLRTGGKWNDESKWTFTAIENLFDEVRRSVGSTRDTYYIFGHSAGGQFLHRMTLFKSQLRAELILAANAGSYTMPTYGVDYPYGLHDSPITAPLLKERFGRPLVILLGEKDTNPDDRNLPRQPEAQAQGPHRLARGEQFFKTARQQAEQAGVPLAWRVVKVPDVAHSNVHMAPTAARLIFQREKELQATAARE